ncbi:MAG: RNA polymerase sigma factor, RpoD/SigA family, partial [Cyanobacteria bacterium CAN_BIN43]|nr:RNA polymerase sigma factor, RpoD/SigA family [Cyanobacteria bacterium CAN_BIN43]
MTAQNSYADADYEEASSVVHFQRRDDELEPDVDQLDQDVVSLELEYSDSAGLNKNAGRRTTDLVRLYLQEIGRVHLLGRDEEVSEAQNVQRYMNLVERRNVAAEGDPQIKQYVQLIEAHDRL